MGLHRLLSTVDGRVRRTMGGRGAARRRREFYARFVRPGELAVDIGANVGNRVQPLLAIGARVVAVEPLPKAAETLRCRFGGHAGFVLVQKAAGSALGSASITTADASVLSTMSREFIDATTSSGRFRDMHWTDSIEVEVTTLDAIIGEYGEPAF